MTTKERITIAILRVQTKTKYDLAASDTLTDKWKAGERVLIYRLLLGTGLRSTELSLHLPNQIDFERCRFTIEAAKTKNKKAGVLPMRPDLVQSVKEWVAEHGIQSHERIFHYEAKELCDAFYKDLTNSIKSLQTNFKNALDTIKNYVGVFGKLLIGDRSRSRYT